jgi:hypothetical protein
MLVAFFGVAVDEGTFFPIFEVVGAAVLAGLSDEDAHCDWTAGKML